MGFKALTCCWLLGDPDNLRMFCFAKFVTNPEYVRAAQFKFFTTGCPIFGHTLPLVHTYLLYQMIIPNYEKIIKVTKVYVSSLHALVEWDI